jgi:hypothetical protein
MFSITLRITAHFCLQHAYFLKQYYLLHLKTCTALSYLKNLENKLTFHPLQPNGKSMSHLSQ